MTTHLLVVGSLLAMTCAGASSSTARAAHAVAPPPRVAIDTALKRQTLDELANLINDNYVFPSDAVKLSARVRDLAAHEEQWRNDDAREFAERVTKALRATVTDGHLGLFARSKSTGPPVAPESEQQIREQLRRRGFDFVGARYLRGAVGYLEIRSMPPYEWVRDTLNGAMQYLASCDALIIDLRRNGGGAADTPERLASYFFAQPTELGTSVHRRRGETKNISTPPAGGSPLAKVEVYILTSRQTVSAAEAFAYSLQGHRRATIVGETTQGAANAGDMYTINDVFDAFIPDLSGKHPVTGRNWEGTGIVPDIPVRAERALSVAHIEALRRLAARTTDAERRREYEWARAAVERASAPPRLVDLQRHTGRYGPIRIWVANATLHYQRDSEPIEPLDAITDQLFMFQNIDQLQLVFESNPAALVIRRSNGRETRRLRDNR